MSATVACKADTQQLMSLITSACSNKEIFLCEVMPNFFDLRDKIRYESITHPDKVEAQPDFSSLSDPIRPSRSKIQVFG